MDIALHCGCVLPTMVIPGIHCFDAHRLQPPLLQASALQVQMRESPLVGPEGAGETVDDPSSEEERATALDDPTEMEIKHPLYLCGQLLRL